MSRTNKGNDEWEALAKRDRPGPPVRLSLRPEDVYQQRGQAEASGIKNRLHGRENDR